MSTVPLSSVTNGLRVERFLLKFQLQLLLLILIRTWYLQILTYLWRLIPTHHSRKAEVDYRLDAFLRAPFPCKVANSALISERDFILLEWTLETTPNYLDGKNLSGT